MIRLHVEVLFAFGGVEKGICLAFLVEFCISGFMDRDET